MCPTRLLHPRSQVKHLMTRKAAEFDVHVPPLSQLVDKEVRPALLSLRTRGSREDKAGKAALPRSCYLMLSVVSCYAP